MASILLIQRRPWQNLGIMSLSAVLGKAGHAVALSIGGDIKRIAARARALKPRAVGFSVMTGDHQWALDTARAIRKESDALTVFGGPHPTYFPELIEQDGVDIIARGEGETACVAILAALELGKDVTGIPNVWAKADGRVFRNDPGPYEDLDSLPFPDRRLYLANEVTVDWSALNVITSRGCPYACTFCYEKQLRALYQGKGRHVRVRKAESIIEEILSVRGMGILFKSVFFVDDFFGTDHEWLASFLSLYKEQIRVPFTCLIRPESLVKHPECARMLKEAGCQNLAFGVETGNESLRNRVLRKAMDDETIFKAAEVIHEAGIPFKTYNLFGFPEETVTDACSTVEINIRIRTDYPLSNLFIPFPKTDLTEYAIAKGFLDPTTLDHIGNDTLVRSYMKIENKIFFERIHRLFQTAVWFPRSWPLIKRLCSYKIRSRFFERAIDLWFGFIYFLVYWRSSGRSLRNLISYAIKNYRDVLG